MSNALECNGVVKQYRDFQLGPLDFSLQKGRVLGYIGPNGAGKTTTMHCISGLVRPDRGEISIFGKSVDPNKPAWKHDIGYVGDQQVFYEEWTAAQNLGYIKQFYPAWSDDAAGDLARRFDLPLDKKARDLSGGNRVKLSLIRALSYSPRLLVFDEPTAGLDPVVRTDLLTELFRILEDGEKSIIYSTHILSDIEGLADEIAFLVDGALVRREIKEDMIQTHFRVIFTLDAPLPLLPACLTVITKDDAYEADPSDKKKTISILKETGAANIHTARMKAEEIAVAILRHHREKSTTREIKPQ